MPYNTTQLSIVMRGLVPRIPLRKASCFLSEMAGTSPAMTTKV
jgi:hypothetical protein